MLYTKEPLELIFPQDIAKVKYIQVECGIIEAKLTQNGYEINRLISTNLKSYLNEDFRPGSSIDIPG
ncbi:MAG: YlzJ-like family protein [Oscillospiraceae bacterium]